MYVLETGFHLWAGEERLGAVGVKGRPERTWWRAVSCSIHQVLTTVGSPMAPGSCTPGSQRRGTGLLQSDIVVFANVIVIVLVFVADGKRSTLSG